MREAVVDAFLLFSVSGHEKRISQQHKQPNFVCSSPNKSIGLRRLPAALSYSGKNNMRGKMASDHTFGVLAICKINLYLPVQISSYE